MQKLLRLFRKYPWLSNVTVYGSLFASADLVQQWLTKSKDEVIDLTQTAKVGLIGLCFHANFNFFWFKALEHVWPGSAARCVIKKVVTDQLVAGPITISAFYTGLSFLDGEEDVFKTVREKLWPTYKTGVVYWSTVQAVNFSIIPPFVRTAYIGACSFVWTSFLCYVRHHNVDQVLKNLLQMLPTSTKNLAQDTQKEKDSPGK
ncbi:mpv17-like protein [Protopterus annectens]|uniref:mpv17-like protein n=1 Tax=Protopterus annectens TaxID=7888 RepID=UPI001CF9C6F7|nr:mpv17-like protein [Protopterus annectens]XP_043936595.1 mpv17-like protein [Protopterus annectens]